MDKGNAGAVSEIESSDLQIVSPCSLLSYTKELRCKSANRNVLFSPLILRSQATSNEMLTLKNYNLVSTYAFYCFSGLFWAVLRGYGTLVNVDLSKAKSSVRIN